MQTITSNKIVDNYFRFMKNWDIDLKKDLIIKLTESIHTKSKVKFDFSSCFGAWEDERDADVIINDLINDRVNKEDLRLL